MFVAKRSFLTRTPTYIRQAQSYTNPRDVTTIKLHSLTHTLVQQSSDRSQTLPPVLPPERNTLGTHLLHDTVSDMCKHDVTNIQHIIVNMHDIRYDMDCSLVGLDCETCPPITLKHYPVHHLQSSQRLCVFWTSTGWQSSSIWHMQI